MKTRKQAIVLLSLLFYLLLTKCSFCQSESGVHFDLLSPVDKKQSHLFSQYSKRYSLLKLDKHKVNTLLKTRPQTIRIPITINEKEQIYVLNQVEILSDNFHIRTSEGQTYLASDFTSIYYQGYELGNISNSAVFSIHDNQIQALISSDKGNVILAQIEENQYILYNDADLNIKSNFSCSSDRLKNNFSKFDYSMTEENKSSNAKVINIFVECDHHLYKELGGEIQKVQSFIGSLINEVSFLYSAEKIDINLSDVFIWQQNDPYSSFNDVEQVLNSFGLHRKNNYQGDMAHLITSRQLGGGIAWINMLCETYSTFREDRNRDGRAETYSLGPYAVSSNFTTELSAFPTYSWNVDVFAHEMGHTIGSPHTHACQWGREGDQALDNCERSEGRCIPGPPPPSTGGTIMSYCHNSVGVNFKLGFGNEPGNLIFNKVRRATCLVENANCERLNCNDNDCTTTDRFDRPSCSCINEPQSPPLCDDGNCNTRDFYNEDECRCEHEIRRPPNCDDNDCSTIDRFNEATCSCENTRAAAGNCDDNDCSTIDSYDVINCICKYDPISPLDCDDNDCSTIDRYNQETCSCENTTVAVDNCNDNDCTTIDSYDSINCECKHELRQPPNCNDNDCSTIDRYNEVTCRCENTRTADNDCDDNDCSTIDFFDVDNCQCKHEPVQIPQCNDNDCNTLDFYDFTMCTCIHEIKEPLNCNDNNCTTTDYYDETICSCVHEEKPIPSCDDNDCTTTDLYDQATCTCIYTACDNNVITCPSDISVSCIIDFDPNQLSFNNTCSKVTITNQTNLELISGLDRCTNAVYKYSFTAIDDCNNSIECTTQINLNHDSPIIECPQAITLANISEYASTRPTISSTCLDQEYSVVILGITLINSGDCNTSDHYQENYSIRDDCNSSFPCVQDIYILPPPPPTCDDNDCGTEDIWDTDSCECKFTIIPVPDCDDGVCSNGVETWYENICECVAGQPPVIPNCDDRICYTQDIYNEDSCECQNIGNQPEAPVRECLDQVIVFDSVNCNWEITVDCPCLFACPSDEIIPCLDFACRPIQGSNKKEWCIFLEDINQAEAFYIFAPNQITLGEGTNTVEATSIYEGGNMVCYESVGQANCDQDNSLTIKKMIIDFYSIDSLDHIGACDIEYISKDIEFLENNTYNISYQYLDRNNVASTCTKLLVEDCGNPSSLETHLWTDENKDGIQDSNERGMPNIIVELKNDNGELVSSKTTDIDGNCNFVAIIEGFYFLHYKLPDIGYQWSPYQSSADSSEDSDVSTEGNTELFYISSGRHIDDIDAGLYLEPISIGGLVWHDLDADGLQNDGPESIVGVEDMSVSVSDMEGNEVFDAIGELVLPKSTDKVGNYTFDNLLARPYMLTFTPPEPTGLITKYNWSPVNNPGNSDIDIDVTIIPGTLSATSGVIQLESGVSHYDIDAGVVISLSASKLFLTGNYDTINDQVLLQWETSNEMDLEGFSIEKASTANGPFTKLAFIPKQNRDAISYKYSDYENSGGEYFYRVKKLFTDNSVKQSNIVSIMIEYNSAIDLILYPNPVEKQSQIEITGKFDPTQINVEFYGVNGCEIYPSLEHHRTESSSTIHFGVKEFSNGLYIARIRIGDVIFYRKFMVVK